MLSVASFDQDSFRHFWANGSNTALMKGAIPGNIWIGRAYRFEELSVD